MNWPPGKRAAVSVTFDDARPSQITHGLPILDAHRIAATFYVSLGAMEQNLDAWRTAVERGHEIGNHTVTHPCSANFSWSRLQALEDFSEAEMERELADANQRIFDMLAVTPVTFAYPCGQKFIGRGENTRSYVPLVARRFLAGRGFRDECVNNPRACDLAQLAGVHGDALSFDELKVWIDRAVESGGWLILAMHDVADAKPPFGSEPQGRRQAVTPRAFQSLCDFLANQSEIWTATVADIAKHVQRQQSTSPV